MQLNENILERMREELNNPELMKKRVEQELAMDALVEATKKRFAEEGRDFDKEFNEWRNNKNVR